MMTCVCDDAFEHDFACQVVNSEHSQVQLHIHRYTYTNPTPHFKRGKSSDVIYLDFIIKTCSLNRGIAK